MELLPEEFKNFARYIGLSDITIGKLIGDDLLQATVVNPESLSWRKLPSKNSLSVENWKLLEKPSKILTFKKIARREIFQEYKLFCDFKSKYISVLGITRYNAILFEEFDSKNIFINSLIDKYKDYQTVDQDLKFIENISGEEWFVIVALIELFLERYPTPDADWIPTDLLVFTEDSLIQTIEESENKIEDQTWWGHWKEISKSEMPNIEYIETAILILANKKLIGYTDNADEKDIYYIGQELLWLIRSLAWWDRGFVIEDKENSISLFFMQASSLFVLINENDTNYSLLNINGTDLERVVDNFIALDEQSIDNKNSKIIKEQNRQLFCTNCGKQLPIGAKFCPYCGAKIA